MFQLLFALILFLHGSFALAVQHFFPSKLAGFFAPKKAESLHQLFPVSLYPPAPDSLSGYWLGLAQVLVGFFILKNLARL